MARRVIRLRLTGVIDVPMAAEINESDEEQMSEAIQAAVTGLTADDWADAVEIDDAEIGEIDDTTGEFRLTQI